jgi:DNA-binding NarL/FixJ family response regulator
MQYTPMIRILIADDHPIVRGGLQQLIDSTQDMHVVGMAATRQDVLQACERLDVDVLVLDLSMPGVQGLSLLQEVRDARPELPVVILSMHNEGQIVHRAMKLGAAAYTAKDSHPMYLLEAIRKVHAGSRYIDPGLLESVAHALSPSRQAPHDLLSGRELQVLSLLVAGVSIGEIATQLHLSPKTVSTHKMRIMHKLEIGNNADLIRYAIQHGLG